MAHFSRFLLLILMTVAIAGMGPASADTAPWAGVTVGPTGTHQSLGRAINAAGPGGQVLIQQGTYAVRDLTIPHDITLIGQGEVTLYARQPVAKGLLVPLTRVSLDVRNITFRDARSPDRNGAGIRHEGRQLLVTDCQFIGNENGILATADGDAEVFVLNSRFIDNGHGDGYSHAIYMSNGSSMLVENSRFEGTRIGHHVKSIANLTTTVRASYFDDTDGRPSYVVDATGGGTLTVEGNTIIRRASAEQETLINYDTSRAGALGQIIIRNNNITNHKQNARLLRNPERAPVTLTGNRFQNASGGELRLPDQLPASGLPDQRPVIAPPPVTDIDQTPASLDGLTPRQRRAVEALRRQGVTPQALSGDPATIPEYRSDRDRTGPTAPPPPDPAGPVGGILPVFTPQRVDHSGRITTLAFAPLSGTLRRSPMITFGMPFAEGVVRPGDLLVLAPEAQTGEIPLQMDVKATHGDGSVRHGIVTADLGQLGPNGGSFALVNRGPSAAGPALSLQPDADFVVEIAGTGPGGARFSRTVRMGDAPTGFTRDSWLAGPLVREADMVFPVTSLLTLRITKRQYADDATRYRVTVENHKTFAKGVRDHTYDLTIRKGPEVLGEWTAIRHHRGANWSRVVWTGGQPRFAAQYDPAYLIKTNAVPPFSLDFGIARQVVNGMAEPLSRNADPFTPGLLTPYMPTTGMRGEIGMLPAWDIVWLKTQNSVARQAMITMAARSGAIPWHFEDERTGNPVRVDQRPNFWAEERGTNPINGADTIPESYFESSDGGWTVDLAHKPLLSYTTYLVTGDQYFARELAHEASFSLAHIWPALRRSDLGPLDGHQNRAKAWLIRDLSAAAWLLPDEAPMKGYVRAELDKALGQIANAYVRGGALDATGPVEGYFPFAYNDPPTPIAPWQQDFIVMALSLEAMRGSDVAEDIARWMIPFHTNRFLSDAGAGLFAMAGRLHVAHGGVRLDDWSVVRQVTEANEDMTFVYPDYAGGYAASAYGALAMLYRATGDERAARALGVLQGFSETTPMFDPANQGGVHREPNFIMEMPE